MRQTFQIRSNKDFEWGALGRVSSIVCFIVSGGVVVLGIVFSYLATQYVSSLTDLIVGILPAFIIAWSIFFAWKIARLGLRLRCLTAKATLEADRRPPILYLRPFYSDKDLEKKTSAAPWWSPAPETRIEELYASSLKRLGPVLAVKKPGERLSLLGASRMTFSDDVWMDEVLKLMNNCRLIAFHTVVSEAVGWEMTQAFALKPFKPILLCLTSSEESLVPIDKQYEMFLRLLAAHVPASASKLPEILGEDRYFLFRDPENVVGFANVSGAFPLQILDYFQPGLSAEIQRKTTKSKRLRLLIFGLILLVVLTASIIYLLAYAKNSSN
jgi:hypothetical protein